jgi:hypothetical protein
VKFPPIPADMLGDHLVLFKHARTLLQKYLKDGGKEMVLIKDAMYVFSRSSCVVVVKLLLHINLAALSCLIGFQCRVCLTCLHLGSKNTLTINICTPHVRHAFEKNLTRIIPLGRFFNIYGRFCNKG